MSLQTYEKALEQLERLTSSPFEKGELHLRNITTLCEASDNPQRHFKSIHIAGTNGKGSVSHMMASILQEAGYKVGLYTSPHLIDFRERIQVNGQLIPKVAVRSLSEELLYDGRVDSIRPSFFEVSVWMAYRYFFSKQVDWAVIETGLGGRLDATNTLQPAMSLITNIGYDHQEVLGNTIQEIAREKAGIIKANTPVLVGEKKSATEKIFNKVAAEKQAPLCYTPSAFLCRRVGSASSLSCYEVQPNQQLFDKKKVVICSSLLGDYQADNIALAYHASFVMNRSGLANIEEKTTVKGIENVSVNTQFRARWEVVSTHPIVVADVAHNQGGLEAALKQLKQLAKHQGKKMLIIYGCLATKPLGSILPLFPVEATYYFVQANTKRALAADVLRRQALSYGLEGTIFNTVGEALGRAMQVKEAIVFITGSFYVVGEAINYLEKGSEITSLRKT